jgi:proteic killer suppression protein
MIVSIRHKGLKLLWTKNDPSKLPYDQIEKIRRILDLLDIAQVPGDMNFSGFGLHLLRGDLEDFWSVTVRANWRIIFQIRKGRVYLVDYLDYH